MKMTERRKAQAKAQAIARTHEDWLRKTQATTNANPLIELKECRCLLCDLKDVRQQHYRGG